MKNSNNSNEIEKLKTHVIVNILKYIPNATLSQTILRKTTGNITLISMDEGEEQSEQTYPFDTFIQIIDGTAQVVIKGKLYNLQLGEGIVIPAHAKHNFNAQHQFKMISSTIKSGYDE